EVHHIGAPERGERVSHEAYPGVLVEDHLAWLEPEDRVPRHVARGEVGRSAVPADRVDIRRMLRADTKRIDAGRQDLHIDIVFLRAAGRTACIDEVHRDRLGSTGTDAADAQEQQGYQRRAAHFAACGEAVA